MEGYSYIAVDIETTGLDPVNDRIIEIGAIHYVNGSPLDTFVSFINPQCLLPKPIIELTKITDEMLVDAPTQAQAMDAFLKFADNHDILGHNVLFDYSFLKTAAVRCGYSFERNGIDTLSLCNYFHKESGSKSLRNMCNFYQITNLSAHRAYHDAKAAAELYEKIRLNFEKNHKEKFIAHPLHYKIKKQEAITIKQKKYLLALVKHHRVTLSLEVNTLTKREASKLIDQMISTYGKLY